MKQVNYLSDFKIWESLQNAAPFRFTYYIRGVQQPRYVISYDGYNYVNCRPDGDRLLIPFKAQFSPGVLMVDREYYLSDSDFSDGILHLQVNGESGIEIITGQADNFDIIVEVPPNYQQGIPGEAMTWDKMSLADKQTFKSSILNDLKDEILTSEKIEEVADVELYNL